jgi:hypothetical protein
MVLVIKPLIKILLELFGRLIVKVKAHHALAIEIRSLIHNSSPYTASFFVLF